MARSPIPICLESTPRGTNCIDFRILASACIRCSGALSLLILKIHPSDFYIKNSREPSRRVRTLVEIGSLKIYDDDVPKQAKKAWDKLADWYSARKKASYEFKILLPRVMSLLSNLSGKKLIDIGCGSCAYSAEFAARGADVFGVDISRGMLGRARASIEANEIDIQLLMSDAHSLPYVHDSFDITVFMLTILDPGMVKEAARVLRPNGILLFSDTHPLIEAKGHWKSQRTGAPILIEDYFSKDKRKWQIEYDRKQTIQLRYHTRTIEQCVNMLADAGFSILRIAEPEPVKSLKKHDPKGYDKYSRIPYFIIYLAQKH